MFIKILSHPPTMSHYRDKWSFDLIYIPRVGNPIIDVIFICFWAQSFCSCIIDPVYYVFEHALPKTWYISWNLVILVLESVIFPLLLSNAWWLQSLYFTPLTCNCKIFDQGMSVLWVLSSGQSSQNKLFISVTQLQLKTLLQVQFVGSYWEKEIWVWCLHSEGAATMSNKQRFLTPGHQGWNDLHSLCRIGMEYYLLNNDDNNIIYWVMMIIIIMMIMIMIIMMTMMIIGTTTIMTMITIITTTLSMPIMKMMMIKTAQTPS